MENMKELKKLIDMVLVGEVSNIRLLTALNKEFTKRGLRVSVPSLLFQNNLESDDLKKEELIAFLVGCYHFFKEDDKYNPQKFFTVQESTNYNMLEPKKEEVSDIIKFEEVRKINNHEYTWYAKAEQLAYLLNNRKIVYYKDIQRATKTVTLPNGEKIEKTNVNKKGLSTLKSRFLKEDIQTTSISFTILLFDDKIPFSNFESKYKNTGDLTLKIEEDMTKEDFCIIAINDGYHRLTSIVDAWEENHDINVGLDVFIRFLTVDEAKQLTYDTFQQNTTDKMYVESLKVTKESQILEMIVDSSKAWKNNITGTYKQCKQLKKRGYRNALNETIKLLELNTNNDIKLLQDTKKIANIIDTFYNYIESEKIEKEYINTPNFCMGMLGICSSLIKEKQYKIKLGEIIEDMIKIEDNKIIEELQLISSNYDNKKIFNYFKNLVNKEVSENV